METTRVILLVAAMASMAAGCSKNEAGTASPPRTPSTAATASTAAAPPPQPPTRAACAMVTAAEMSTIIGTPVAAKGEDGRAQTTCHYQPAGSSTPYIKVEVVWGDGQVAMMGTRMAARLEPGLAAKLAGLGDEASVVGPAVWVRTGEDLVMLTFTGVEDHIAAAKRIITLMRPRMGGRTR